MIPRIINNNTSPHRNIRRSASTLRGRKCELHPRPEFNGLELDILESWQTKVRPLVGMILELSLAEYICTSSCFVKCPKHDRRVRLQ